MNAGIKLTKGSMLLNYEIQNIWREDAIYQWVEAVERASGESVLLQLLRSPLPAEVVANLFTYFETLQSIQRKGLVVPEQLFSSKDYALILRYPCLQAELLKQALDRAPHQLLAWLDQAGQLLFTLHNKNTVHGLPIPDSFLVIQERVYVIGFGYGLLLGLGRLAALPQYKDFIAPEIIGGKNPTVATDIYTYAKTVACWEPRLRDSAWYQRATDPNPVKRFSRMREALAQLREVVDISLRPEETTKPLPRAEESVGDLQPSVLIPKYSLEIHLQPDQGGKVTGSGQYARDEAVALYAIPNQHWDFVYWSGDLEGPSNPTKLVMNAPKRVVAHFALRAQPVLVTLTVNVYPPDAGTVIGSGRYHFGERVSVKAYSQSLKWQFDHWDGDLLDSRNPLHFIIDGNKTITACFKPGLWSQEVVLTVNVDPLQGGEVTGAGTYLINQQVTVKAKPRVNWRFSHWTGDFSGIESVIMLNLDKSKTVIAHFVEERLEPNQQPSLGRAFQNNSLSVKGKDVSEEQASKPKKPKLGKAFQ